MTFHRLGMLNAFFTYIFNLTMDLSGRNHPGVSSSQNIEITLTTEQQKQNLILKMGKES